MSEENFSNNGSNQIGLGGEFGEPSGEQPGMVDNYSERDGSSTSSDRGEPATMAMLARSHPETYTILVKEVEEMGGVFFRYFFGQDVNVARRYVSDVILYDNERQLSSLLAVLDGYGRARRNGLFGYSVEPGHVHVIHDCTYGGNWCRDSFRQAAKPFGVFRPPGKSHKPIFQFTKTDFYDVFIYFFLIKRGTRKIWARGESWETPTDGKANC